MSRILTDNKNEEKKTAIETLKKEIKKGDSIYTVLTKVNNMGTYRHIKPILFKDNQPLFLTYQIATALQYPIKEKTYSIGVGGCGMDMGFHLIYNLSSTLFGDGYAIKQRWL